MGVDDGSLLAKMQSPASFNCTVYCADELQWQDVIASLRKMRFKGGVNVVNPQDRVCETAYIEFDKIPRSLLQSVIGGIQEKEPLEFRTIKTYTFGDGEISIYLPKRSREPLLRLVQSLPGKRNC